MKKIIILMLMLSTLVFCSCDSDSSPADPSNSSATSTDITVPSEEDSPKNATTSFATNNNEFKENINKLIDPSEYEIDEEEDNVWYSSNADSEINLDYTIEFKNNKKLTLPTDLKTVLNLGFTTDSSENTEISNTIQHGIEFKNSNNESFLLWITNTKDLNSEVETSVPLNECKFYGISIDLFSAEYKETEDYELYYKEENGCAFSVCNGITQDSTIQEVIEKLGNPTDIDYNAEDKEIEISYSKRLENGYSRITFRYIADENCMYEMYYTYSLEDIK